MPTASNPAINPPDASRSTIRRLPTAWIIGFGILLFVLGLLAFASVMAATLVSVYFVGLMMIVAGVAEIALGLRAREWGPFVLWIALGIFYALSGLLTLANPLLAASILTLFLGAALVATGVLRLIVAFQMKAGSASLWVGLSAVITLCVGATILAQWPLSSLYALGIFLSVDLLFAGMGWIGLGMALSRFQSRP